MSRMDPGSLARLLQKNPSELFLRFWATSVLAVLIALLFGFAFALIVFGILVSSFKLAAYWEPAYKFFLKFTSTQPVDPDFKPMYLPKYLLPLHIVSIAARIAVIGIGIWVLFRLGFYGQNLILLILFHH